MNLYRLLVFILAIGQIYSSYFGGFTGENSFSTPIITPAGYAFAIWGVITFGCLVYGVYQLLPKQRDIKLYDQMAWPLIITFTGFSAWIYVAVRDILWATVVIFTLMLISLWRAYSYLLKSKIKLSKFENILIRGTFGLYIAWATAATVINLATALSYYDFIYADTRSLFTYIAILLAALANSLYGLFRIRFNGYYFATIIWAFVAICVNTFEQGSMVLTGVGLMAVGVMGLVWMKYRRV